jgi:hypothetical protein
MTMWADRILKEFPSDLVRLWIVADPDDVLLDERVLSRLRDQGYNVLPFEDSIAFRAEYEEGYRAAWDRGESGPSRALILQLRGTQVYELPWDYRRQAREVSLSLSDLFSKLSYPVVRQLGTHMLPRLFEAQKKYAHHTLGEALTKDFVLTHIFQMCSPHLIIRHEDLWRELLRLLSRESLLPLVLADHVGQVVGEHGIFKGLQVTELFSNRSVALRFIQEAWYRYLAKLGVSGTNVAEPPHIDYGEGFDVPFEHTEVRVIVSMFLDGTLHPLMVDRVPDSLPEWAKVGVVKDPSAMRNLILAGVSSLAAELPDIESLHRDWIHFARKMAEVLSRFHSLKEADSETIKDKLVELQIVADERLREWVGKYYADLPLRAIDKGPIMVHHVPRVLSLRRSSGEDKIALLVFDGLSIDQWIQIRDKVANSSPQLVFDENACFAWLPTLTSVSRQALFSGLRPREFGDSIEITSKEPAMWSRFWQDQGLRANEVLFRKSIKRIGDLSDLDAQLSNSPVKVAGIVVDTVDDFVHGAVLGKRDIAQRVASWCDSKFVDRLFELLLGKGFHVYVTSDHGNVEATGIGRPNQGVASETRGERVRTYRSEALLSESAAAFTGTFRLDVPGLPANFLPLFATGHGAFVPKGEHVVSHGGMSVEELFVPFIEIKRASKIA